MEYLDVIDQHNKVVGKAAKNEIYEKKLPHRIVHVWLFNDRGELAVAMRAAGVSYKPLHWCSTAAGHVSAGESFLDAGYRELMEECKIKTDLKLKDSVWYEGADAPGLKKILGLCEGSYQTPIAIRNAEVDRVEFLSINKIQNLIKHGEPIHPEFLFLFNKHYPSIT
ncbi:MAG: NUDIX domain-containing protein [Patescibacteria group bacterium]